MMQTGVSSVEQFSLLLELSRAFSALIELEELLPTVIAKTQEVLQAESCALLLLDEERQELFFPFAKICITGSACSPLRCRPCGSGGRIFLCSCPTLLARATKSWGSRFRRSLKKLWTR